MKQTTEMMTHKQVTTTISVKQAVTKIVCVNHREKPRELRSVGNLGLTRDGQGNIHG